MTPAEQTLRGGGIELEVIIRILALPLLLIPIIGLCIGHYRNHTSEWMEARGYRSHEEIIGRILMGVKDWVLNG